MKLLYILLAVIAGVIFLATPFWAAVGYLVALVWNAFLLYLIFQWPDPISQAMGEHRVEMEGGAVLEKR